MKSLIIFFFTLMPLIGNCKKTIEIPKNKIDSLHFNNIQASLNKYSLENLSLSEDSLKIRIWMGDNIAEITKSEAYSAKLILSVKSNKSDILIIKSETIDSAIAKQLYDSLEQLDILNLKGNKKQGIDGQYYIFEISTPNKYRIYSYWSPSPNSSLNDNKMAANILEETNTLLNTKCRQQNFDNKLDPGIYRRGMSTFRKDKLLEANINRSSLYNEIEKILRAKFNIDEQTNYHQYPLLLLNNEDCFLKEINNIEYNQSINIIVLVPNDPTIALYGTRGINGIIRIETK